MIPISLLIWLRSLSASWSFFRLSESIAQGDERAEEAALGAIGLLEFSMVESGRQPRVAVAVGNARHGAAPETAR